MKMLMLLQAASLKAEANKAFAAKDYTTAVKLYSDGIALDPQNHVLYSNRSAAKSGLKDYQGALEDSEEVSCVSPARTIAHAHAHFSAVYQDIAIIHQRFRTERRRIARSSAVSRRRDGIRGGSAG